MKMKLSRTAWFILGIGIFVLAFGSLFIGYSRLSGEEGNLEDELSADQELLPQLVSQSEYWAEQLSQLESQLTQAESSLQASKARFSAEVESIEYDEELVLLAHDCDLEIASLTASEPRDKEVEEITYTVTIFEVEVRPATSPPTPLTKSYIDNAISNILVFINTIATGEYFNTANIELVSIEAPEAETEEGKPSAVIELMIYSYQGE
jgi:hypothetical protein